MLHLAPLWVGVRCGGCGQSFTANARSVPNWKGEPACKPCWDRVNRLRASLGLEVWEAPAGAYPDVGG